MSIFIKKYWYYIVIPLALVVILVILGIKLFKMIKGTYPTLSQCINKVPGFNKLLWNKYGRQTTTGIIWNSDLSPSNMPARGIPALAYDLYEALGRSEKVVPEIPIWKKVPLVMAGLLSPITGIAAGITALAVVNSTDEAKIMGIFSQMPSQLALSSFYEYFSNVYKTDMYTALVSSLSETQFYTILDILSYKPEAIKKI